MCAKRVVAFFWGLRTPVQIASDRDTINEDFGPFYVSLCFEVRIGGRDVVALVVALNISDNVMGGFV